MPTLPRIMVAPNGARRTKADHPALPMTQAEIVDTAIACAEAGADGIHFHHRAADGTHSLDPTGNAALLAALQAAVPNMYLQATTEAAGIFQPPEQMAMVRAFWPPHISVGARELLRPEGDNSAALAFYAECQARGIHVQHILYDASEFALLRPVLEAGSLPTEHTPLMFVLGKYSGQNAAPSDLDPFLAELDRWPLKADWMTCAFGPDETACLAYALGKGGKVRVGFENNIHQSPGVMAKDNASRVAEIAALCERQGREIGAGEP